MAKYTDPLSQNAQPYQGLALAPFDANLTSVFTTTGTGTGLLSGIASGINIYSWTEQVTGGDTNVYRNADACRSGSQSGGWAQEMNNALVQTPTYARIWQRVLYAGSPVYEFQAGQSSGVSSNPIISGGLESGLQTIYISGNPTPVVSGSSPGYIALSGTPYLGTSGTVAVSGSPILGTSGYVAISGLITKPTLSGMVAISGYTNPIQSGYVVISGYPYPGLVGMIYRPGYSFLLTSGGFSAQSGYPVLGSGSIISGMIASGAVQSNALPAGTPGTIFTGTPNTTVANTGAKTSIAGTALFGSKSTSSSYWTTGKTVEFYGAGTVAVAVGNISFTVEDTANSKGFGAVTSLGTIAAGTSFVLTGSIEYDGTNCYCEGSLFLYTSTGAAVTGYRFNGTVAPSTNAQTLDMLISFGGVSPTDTITQNACWFEAKN